MVESQQFIPNITQVELVLKEMADKQKNDLEIKVELDPEQCQTQPVNNYFLCTICTNVVWKPLQCSTCEKINCSNCVEQWIQKSKTCPSCNSDFKPSEKVGLLARNTLDEFKFNCKKKGCKEFLYKDALTHLSQDNILSLACLLKCGHPEKLKGIEQMKQHLMTECTKVDLKCSKCEAVVPRLRVSEHGSCQEYLKSLIEEQKGIIKEKDEVIAEMGEEIRDLKKELRDLRLKNNKLQNEKNSTSKLGHSESKSKLESNVKKVNLCSAGHQMQFRYDPPFGPGIRQCDRCKEKFFVMQGFFNCGNIQCDYDLCATCGGGKEATLPTCQRQHTMKFIRRQESESLRLGPYIIPLNKPLVCSDYSCRERIQSEQGYWNCGNKECEWNFCARCGIKRIQK